MAAIIAGGGISKLASDPVMVDMSPWLPLALLVVAAVIARARWSRTEAVVGTLLRR